MVGFEVQIFESFAMQTPEHFGRGYEVVGHLRFIRAEDNSATGATRPDAYG
jgi:hypothetical protein